MSRFSGTSLPSLSKDADSKEIQTQVRKAILDLLKKDNTLYDDLFPISGSTPAGSYIKLPNGILFQFGVTIQSIAITIATGSGFVGNSGSISYPISFDTFTTLAVNGRSGIWCSNNITTTPLSTFGFSANYWSSVPAVARNWDWQAWGTWK